MNLTIPAAVNGGGPGILNVDTGLTQVGRAFPEQSTGEPAFTDPSRIQVIPLAPVSAWATPPVSHGEPFLDPATNTIHVTFSNPVASPATINVLFWDPHTLVCPGAADLYNSEG